MGWWAGRHHRRRAREASGEAARLEREVQRLRQTDTPSTEPNRLAPRDQKALERQSALVASELSSVPTARGPFQ
jgi:hypothetical protein